MSDWNKRIEFFANIAIVIVCVLLTYVLFTRWVLREETPQVRHTIPTGYKLSVPEVSWSRTNTTLVMVLSTKCHFCSESAEFYRLLIPSIQQKNVQVVAVFPQPEFESKEYLRNLGIPVVNVHQAGLESLKVSGTPTLLVVNREGTVTTGWVGKLSADQQKQVLSSF